MRLHVAENQMKRRYRTSFTSDFIRLDDLPGSSDTCPPESSVFGRAGESIRQEVAGQWPFGRITKRHNAASGGKVIALEKLHNDENQRIELGGKRTQLEDQLTSKARAPKSLTIQGDEKCFPKIALRTHHNAATCGILRQLIGARKSAQKRG
jgi:hypothetical protein